jgi:outer membrane protein OmpA-like peptidoglycan-associated protein
MAADALLAAKAPEPREQPLTSVQFEVGSAALTPGGQIHVAAAAVMLGDMTLERVRVLGHTDRTGSLDLNRALAAARARAVAELLVASGVAAELVEPEGMGWQDLPIPTDDGVAEPLNRSVAIVAVALPTS